MPDAAELAELDDEELESRLIEYRRELLNLRFQLATSQLDNTSRLPAVRKDIARVMTLLRDREIALAEGRPVTVIAPRPRRPRFEEEEMEEAGEEAEETDEVDYDAQLEDAEFEDEELDEVDDTEAAGEADEEDG